MVGVGAIIVDGTRDNARVALIRRRNPPLAGQWSLPGGMLEVGETVREAAIREAKEETGLDVECGELLGVFDRVLRDAEGRVQYHYVLIDFLCRVTGGELHAGGDASEVKWFSAEEMDALPLMKDTKEVIQIGFAKAAQI